MPASFVREDRRCFYTQGCRRETGYKIFFLQFHKGDIRHILFDYIKRFDSSHPYQPTLK